ncbi:LysR family transcriptional regulator [Rhodanobacter sp. C01]|uniref:LysR family transcriptional regulator n=1 Tax=Rhodanobacter sp. C01 TaxID=1945856 RepID=UPI00098416C4|nr:LysR family transcriptional regulator [Rhodanobacter sp. C01]OOG50951.1 LysR family transcriptional regulator [Rhodanobacter sp. C01]
MDLLALADFNAVARHGGVGRAARITGRPKATLSRRVRQLEDTLGVRLFERGGHELRLTGEGRELQDQTQSLLEHLDEVGEVLRRGISTPRGRLRISAPVLFGQRGLGRIAADYALAYPGVQLEVIAEDRFVDPVDDDFDLIIRANPDPSTDLAGRCFLRDVLAVVAAPSLPRPARQRHVAVPAITLPHAPVDAPWQLSRTRSVLTIATHTVLRLSSMAMIHDAVLAGVGAAAMPRSLVQADIDAGRLIDWGTLADRRIEVWALYPSHRHVSTRVTAFVKLLVDRFENASPAAFARLASTK